MGEVKRSWRKAVCRFVLRAAFFILTIRLGQIDEAILLFAEDEGDLAGLTVIACSRLGMGAQDYRLVRSGSEAIFFFEQAKRGEAPVPSRFITDNTMPGFTGLEVVAWLRQDDQLKETPVTLVSAMLDPQTVVRANALGITELIQKAYAFKALLELIARWRTQ